MFKCPHCGENLPDDSVFCESCGNKVSRFSEQEPATVEAVMPAKKGKSLKIFIAGMLAVIVVIGIFFGQQYIRNFIFGNNNTNNAEQTNGTTNTSSTSESNKADNSTMSSNDSASSTSSTSNNSASSSITSVVGTWTTQDGDTIIFNEDGSLLCARPGNNGAYTMYVGGSYEQKKDSVEIALGIGHSLHYSTQDLFDTKSKDYVSATIADGKLTIPLASGESAIFTQTSKTKTEFAPLQKILGKAVPGEKNTAKYTALANGTFTSDRTSNFWNDGYWVCLTGKQSGVDYGQGVIIFHATNGQELDSYTLPTS